MFDIPSILPYTTDVSTASSHTSSLQGDSSRQRQELAFHARPFILCGLPIRRPPSGTLKYARRNGQFVLEVVAHPDYGLPFGQDRSDRAELWDHRRFHFFDRLKIW